jgi:hypothetical protein
MGIPVLILGESGTGKSASMRNFGKDEIALVNVAGKPLPFKGKFDETINSDSYRTIKKFMKESYANTIVIDDCQYLMANEFMRRGLERGYDKFTEIAVNFWELVQAVKDLPDEKIVIFMSHTERDANGNEKIKTIGKLLDEKITVEGMFTIVLKTIVKDGQYSFQTQNSGHDTVKSPIGLFETNEIDNDLKAVVNGITNYYFNEEPIETAELKTKEVEKPLDGIPVPNDDDLPFYDSSEDATPEPEPKPRKRRTRKEG